MKLKMLSVDRVVGLTHIEKLQEALIFKRYVVSFCDNVMGTKSSSIMFIRSYFLLVKRTDRLF